MVCLTIQNLISENELDVVDNKLLVVISFENSTVVYFYEDGRFQEYTVPSFQLRTNTLHCAGIRRNVMIQICPEGACMIVEGIIKPLWREVRIVHAVSTMASLILATEKRQIVFFVLYPSNRSLVITRESVSLELKGYITCMSLTVRVDGTLQYLAVGISECPCETKCACESSMHEINIFNLRVQPQRDIIFLFRIPMLPYCPVSLFFLDFAANSFSLVIGDKEGNLITSTLPEGSNRFEVTEKKCLGTKPVLFYRVCILHKEENFFEPAILAVSSSMWLKLDSAKDFIRSSIVIPYLITVHPNARIIGVIDNDFFK
ncbi:hypothetical protein TNIN_312141 [Trichonephila inaurata madagascariensis]|uniref:RSE1/DDB1/CPSF1 second beta-propeller domain-containing protein n=1 Tax=Trichonephila inaurata madagascariensis TaxID=2747483 RepID=A0A8X6JUI5_9ARAC|nr:hypothetical protein TNIN_312141 [Trichonephila inaurata madagascariensis]